MEDPYALAHLIASQDATSCVLVAEHKGRLVGLLAGEGAASSAASHQGRLLGLLAGPGWTWSFTPWVMVVLGGLLSCTGTLPVVAGTACKWLQTGLDLPKCSPMPWCCMLGLVAVAAW